MTVTAYLFGAVIVVEIAFYGRRIIKRLDWQHSVIVPWINELNTKLHLPKMPEAR